MSKSRINVKILRSSGFKKGTDGVFRKQGGSHSNPTSRSNLKPNKKQPKRGKKPQGKRVPVRRLVAIVTVKTVRSRDYDGLGASSKHYLDGLQHCGIFEDDSPEFLEVIACSERVSSFSEEETIIEIYEIPK
jgi:Holliday junction resolvase RusA-like endonuclease